MPIRTIVGVNDGGDLFPDNTNSSNLNNNTERIHSNDSTEYLNKHEVERAIVYMHENTVQTVISSTDTPEKIQGSFQYITNDGFSEGTNSVNYSGDSMTSKVTAIFSASSTNNQDLAFYVSINGLPLNDSEGFVTTDSAGKAVNVVCQSVIDLSKDDEVSVMVENYTSTHNVTVENLSLNITSIH